MQPSTPASLAQEPPAETAPAAGGSDGARVRFADAEGAARWLKTLPLNNVSLVYDAILEQLTALPGIELPPRERARIAEVLREQVAQLHTELARRYAGKPQPPTERESEAVLQAIALWHALWEQYSACLKPLLEGDPDLADVKPRLLQRGLHIGKALVLVYGLARRSPPPASWEELHAYYRLSELLGCAGAALSDPLMANGIGISCYSTYSHALLLGLADLCSMSVKQVQLADRWLEMWARKVYPYAEQRETEGPLIVVDLDSATGAALSVTAPASAGASMRFAYAGKLATSVRGRLKRLQTGANPSALQLGDDCSVEQCTTLLSYLDWRWYQPPRRPTDGPVVSLTLCAGGLDGAFYRIAGRTFERRSPLRPFSSRVPHHLASLDALTDYDRGREEAERAWAWERWEGACEWREAVLARKDTPHYRFNLDQLVIVDDGERKRASYVTRVAGNGQDGLVITLRLWSGMPKALAVRPVSTALSDEHPPQPALLLSETPDEKPCLILPSRTFNPGRMLRSVGGGPERRFRLTRLLQRGADFERVAFEETR